MLAVVSDIALVAQAAQSADVSIEALALISGGAAVLGALTGGGIAGWANLRGQKARQGFDREEREAVEARADQLRVANVRGVAREMRAIFNRNIDIYERHSRVGFWWSEEVATPTLFEREADRVLIASVVSAKQWNAIENAERQFAFVTETREISVEFGTRGIREAGDPATDSPLAFKWFGTNRTEDEALEAARESLRSVIVVTRAAVDALDTLC